MKITRHGLNRDTSLAMDSRETWEIIKNNLSFFSAVLQQIFMECDASVSTSTLDSTSDTVPISRLVGYVQDQLPSWSIDDLVELWKCLAAVSTNDHVNLYQFKEATKCWIVKMQQSAQDSNNNVQEKLFLMSDADSSMKNMDKDIVELELREKFRELYDENIVLHDEIDRHEASIGSLKQQHSSTEKQLKHYIQKCQQLEKENDEQRDQLNELIEKEKTMALTLHKYTKQHQSLLKQLEAAEIEVQTIPSLKEKLEKITRDKIDCMRLITKMREELDEKEDNCKQLNTTITQLKDASINMQKSHDFIIQDLRQKIRLLTDENVEMQSLSALSMCSVSGEKLSLSPLSDKNDWYVHSTPYKLKEVPMQDSLYTELKASGFFTAEGSRSDREELEEELNEYKAAICPILEQLEKVIQIFVTMRGSIDDSHFNSQDTDARVYDVNLLKHKAAFLLYMATEEITRRNTRQDSSTQLRADLVNASDSLNQFGVRSFRDLLPTDTQPKAETSLRSIASHCVNNEDENLFSRVIKIYTGVQNRFGIIEPIIEELHDIIESTLDTLVDRKDCPLSGNSRYRSIHTLPSNLQSLQSSSLTAEDSQWQTFSYQNPETKTTDVPFARGDGLMQKDREKSTPLATEAQDVSDQKDLAHSEENRSCKMSKVSSILQIDSKALTMSEKETEKTNTRSFQVPEVSSASNPTSPRRKISVYCRSFDVVAVQDQHEDHSGSNMEVRQSPTNPDDFLDRIAATDQNSTPGAKYSFNQIYRNVKSDSDSSNSTPRKFQDSLDDELLVEEPILRKVRLAPTRLRFPQEIRNDSNGTAEAPVPMNSTELHFSDISPLSPIGEHKEDDVSVHSSSTFIDKCKMEMKSVVLGSNLCLNENVSQAHSIPNRRLFPRNQADSAKIMDSEDPHSQASVRRVDSESQSRIKRSVDSQMSSREDSLAVLDSDRGPAAGSDDRCDIDEKVANEVGKAVNVVSSTSLADPVSTRVTPCKNVMQSDEKVCKRNLLKTKQDIRQWLVNSRRSYSDSRLQNIGQLEYSCPCKLKNVPSIPESNQRTVFPSLTDVYLQKSGIANLSDPEENRENLNELELQETMRQRNSVSGRMTLRKPSFSSESPKWETEKLDRTESSNSISYELRGIFEQVESRRSSKEENNNMLRPNHSNSQSTINCAIIDNEIWANVKEETSPELSDNESINSDRPSTRSSHSFQSRRRRRRLSIWHIVLSSILIFCFVFYMIQAMVITNTCYEPLNKRLIRSVFDRYYQIRNEAPHPM